MSKGKTRCVDDIYIYRITAFWGVTASFQGNAILFLASYPADGWNKSENEYIE